MRFRLPGRVVFIDRELKRQALVVGDWLEFLEVWPMQRMAFVREYF